MRPLLAPCVARRTKAQTAEITRRAGIPFPPLATAARCLLKHTRPRIPQAALPHCAPAFLVLRCLALRGRCLADAMSDFTMSQLRISSRPLFLFSVLPLSPFRACLVVCWCFDEVACASPVGGVNREMGGRVRDMLQYSVSLFSFLLPSLPLPRACPLATLRKGEASVQQLAVGDETTHVACFAFSS